MLKTSSFLIAIVLILSSAVFTEKKERRIALVLSNSESLNTSLNSNQQRPDLISVHKHSANVSLTLSKLGFEVVEVISPDKGKLSGQIRKFLKQLQEADVAVIYYSGHIAQISGRNYLIPFGNGAVRKSDLEFQAVALDPFLHEMQRMKGKKFLFLNACGWEAHSKKGDAQCKGLTPLNSYDNMMIAYANEPDKISANPEDQEKLFATALIDNLTHENAPLSRIMRKVRNDVAFETHSRQLPWIDNNLEQNFVFNPKNKDFYKKTSALAQKPSHSWLPNASAEASRLTGSIQKASFTSSQQNDFRYSHLLSGQHTKLKEVKADLPYTVPEIPKNLTEKKVIRLLQKRLSDAGCYKGGIDGRWGQYSKMAAASFLKNINLNKTILSEPDQQLLTLVSYYSGPVCGAPCSGKQDQANYRQTNTGQCHAVKHPPQEMLTKLLHPSPKDQQNEKPEQIITDRNLIEASLRGRELADQMSGQGANTASYKQRAKRRDAKRKTSIKNARKKSNTPRRFAKRNVIFGNFWGI